MLPQSRPSAWKPLFGTESAASHERKVGALEEAHGGILYLDEVADMPRGTQTRFFGF
jgi:two-component system nitrogen regulation response regulator NtrX